MTVGEVGAFHRRMYDPSRATVIAVGDASHEALAATGGACVRTAGASVDGQSDPDPAALPVVATAPPPIGWSSCTALARRSPSCASATSPLPRPYARLSRARSSLNMILGGQFVSRINMNLREDKGYTYGARTGVRLPARPGSVRPAGERAAGRHRRRDARGARRAARHPRRAPGDAERSSSSGVRRSRAAIRATSRPPIRSPAAPRSSRSTICPTITSRTFVPDGAGAHAADDVTAIAAKHIDPDRLLTVVVGDPRQAVRPSDSQALELGDSTTSS